MKTSFMSMMMISLGPSCVVLTEKTSAFDPSLPNSDDDDDTNAVQYRDGGGDSFGSDITNRDDSIPVDDVEDNDEGDIIRSRSDGESSSASRTTPPSIDDDVEGGGVDGDADGTDAHPHRKAGHSAYYYSNTDANARTSASHDDEQTYLDLFGERAKELLTQHVIPTTDADCRWDWRTGRCEPYCQCAYQFLWGDFHFGRSCRYRLHPPPSQSAIDDVDGTGNDEPSWQEAWQEVWEAQINQGSSTFSPPLMPNNHGFIVPPIKPSIPPP